jgi:hypothetical protein
LVWGFGRSDEASDLATPTAERGCAHEKFDKQDVNPCARHRLAIQGQDWQPNAVISSRDALAIGLAVVIKQKSV